MEDWKETEMGYDMERKFSDFIKRTYGVDPSFTTKEYRTIRKAFLEGYQYGFKDGDENEKP